MSPSGSGAVFSYEKAREAARRQPAWQDHQRVPDLVTTKVSSKAELDNAIEQLHVAKSDL